MGTLNQSNEHVRYGKAYRQGEEAAIDQQPYTSNPFNKLSIEYTAWTDGWIDGNAYLKKVTA